MYSSPCPFPSIDAYANYLTIMSQRGIALFRSQQDIAVSTERGTRVLVVGTSASVCLRRLMYGDGGERRASPWRFADRHGLPPPQSPAERQSQLLKLYLKLHRLARDSDTPRNSVDRAVESRQIALPRSQSLWPRYTALPAQNGGRYRQARAQ